MCEHVITILVRIKLRITPNYHHCHFFFHFFFQKLIFVKSGKPTKTNKCIFKMFRWKVSSLTRYKFWCFSVYMIWYFEAKTKSKKNKFVMVCGIKTLTFTYIFGGFLVAKSLFNVKDILLEIHKFQFSL